MRATRVEREADVLAIAMGTSELPKELATPLELAAAIGELVARAEPAKRRELAGAIALPLDWRERAARLAAIDARLPALLGDVAALTGAARRAVGTFGGAVASGLEQARDSIDAHRAVAAPLLRLAIHVFARHSADVAAVHAQLAARTGAFANVLAIAASGQRRPELLAIAHRDARTALEWILALPASEPKLRRAAIEPLASAIAALQASPRALAGLAMRAAPSSDLALRAAFAALCRGLPAPADARPKHDEHDEHDEHEHKSTAVYIAPGAIRRAIDRAADVLAATQAADGSWHGDYGGPMFLLPMYVGTCHVAGIALDDETRAGMIAYVTAHQNPDGGWGLDVEADSHVFTSVLNYVALRLLGVAASDPRAVNARAWFLPRGGALASASWGKFFLAVLGLYDYDGLAPIPPELWLVPESLPIHPSQMWCHARAVYLPMSYLYGTRAVLAAGAIYDELRGELYAEPYDQIDWRAARSRVAPDDNYKPNGPWLAAVNELLGLYERAPLARPRRRALDLLLEHIAFEDRSTKYLCIGPVNKLLNLLVWHHARPGGDEVKQHVAALPAYLWRADDGVKMQGYESSQLWDTAFGIRALAAAAPARTSATIARASEFLAAHQIAERDPDALRYYRDESRGGWPFSANNGWPTPDCTSAGLKACAALDELGMGAIVPPDRRAEAVARLLAWQNPDGGWASYEHVRGPKWLERLNPSEVFGEIMVDRSYVECTSACMQALHAYAAMPDADRVMRTAIASAIARGTEYLLAAQRADGSFEGSWGVCFTYGAWFGISGLALIGDRRCLAAIDRACAFLGAHQQLDGGWGETVEACRLRRYVHAETGQAVMTSWALLALARAGRATSPEARRGAAFLLHRQQPDGRWPAEHIAGVFNHTCAIHYDSYLRVFPPWALAAIAGAD